MYGTLFYSGGEKEAMTGIPSCPNCQEYMTNADSVIMEILLREKKLKERVAELELESAKLLETLESVTWQGAGMAGRVSSWSLSAYEDAIEVLKERGRLVESPISHQYIRPEKKPS
jgi:hypothetical protein